MEIASLVLEYIASHWWSIIVFALLFLGFEIAVRRVPTSSPYWSIIHSINKGLKFLGKMLIKVIGENLSKTTETTREGTPVLDKKDKPKRLRHK